MAAPPPVGLHILSELYECDKLSQLDKDILSTKICHLVKVNGLTQIGSLFHEFDGGGITAVVALAESHVAIHTWPELGYATFEVYVCNHTRDNSEAARHLHDSLIAYLQPKRIETRHVFR